MPLKKCASIVAKNIYNLEAGKTLETIPKVFPTVFLVTLGPDHAIMQMNDMVTAGAKYAKMKVDVGGDTIKALDGDHQAKKRMKSGNDQGWMLINCCTTCCCCCPMATKAPKTH